MNIFTNMNGENISIINNEFIMFDRENVTIQLKIIHGELNINANAHTDIYIYIYHLTIDSLYSIELYSTNKPSMHISNCFKLEEWIFECAKNNQLHIEIVRSNRPDADAPLILFIWDNVHMERIEIPRIYILENFLISSKILTNYFIYW